MKWQRFFLILFLIPTLIYGLNQEQCTKIHNKVADEWKRHYELIEEFNKVGENERGVRLLNKSVECCRHAIAHCDKILNDIASKPKSKRKKAWRVQIKTLCEQDKNNLIAEIDHIQTAIQRIQSNIASEKANILYQKSVEKAALANAKYRDCQNLSNNIHTVISLLNEVAQMYEEAASLAREALALIDPYPQESNKIILKQAAEAYKGLADKKKNEAVDLFAFVEAQKKTLKEQVTALKEESRLFTENGLKRSCYESQKQIIPILEQLLEYTSNEERDVFKEELAQLRTTISAFEKEADSSRLTERANGLSQEEFKTREKERKNWFFKSDILLNPELFLPDCVKKHLLPRVIPLDGQVGKKEGYFTLFTEQFYRFLIQSDSPLSELFVKVHENGQLIHVEKIVLPLKNTQGWELYLRNGMIFIPETKLKLEYGLDLRLVFVCDTNNEFSMIVAQKSTDPRYQFFISLDKETTLYECHFSAPPPWQLETLCKPALIAPNKRVNQSPLPSMSVILSEGGKQLSLLEFEKASYPLLDHLVEELKKDPLALAGYVHNEIAFVDNYLHQEDGIFYAPSIHRNPCVTYLEKQGSPWEQCQLLVYLLRKAGYQAVYALGEYCSLPKNFVEKMLFTKLPEDQQEGLLKYPWVVFFDGNEWISLFPWMKEMQVHEGHDLYSLMPEEYATANRWILHYLKGDEKILKHIGPDGDDTAGVLFARFVEEELRKQGLSLDDVGIHRTQLKKQFSSWQDFPHPTIQTQVQVFCSLQGIPRLFAYAKLEVCSHENPQKSLSCIFPLAHFNTNTFAIRFSPQGNKHHLHLILGDQINPPLDLDESDHLVNVKIDCEIPLGTQICSKEHTFTVAKGTSAALCSHFGGASSKMTSQYYDQFSSEKDEKKRLSALLSFVGTSYFEKCSRAEKILADLHKVNPSTIFAFGLSKLSPDPSKGPYKSDEDLTMPQVDMFWFNARLPTVFHPSVWHQEFHTAKMQYEALAIMSSSSNEHQILREIFKDPYAISTVKLLQLAHQQHQKKGLEGEGFLSFTAPSFEVADKNPEAAQRLYFSHLKDLNLREVKAASPGQWYALKDLLDPSGPMKSWSYAYMTPGLTCSQDGSYKEMGTLILCPDVQSALISNNNLIFRGGLGSPLPSSYFSSHAIREWELVPSNNRFTNSYTLHIPTQFASSHPSTTPSIIESLPGTTQLISDVRPEHKSWMNSVADPVDTVTGAFYIDEVDLFIPGSFSLEIRRNYNSQNPLIGDLGCGWKLSLNPFLIKQDDKLFAAEADGTVMTYSYNSQTSRWEVFLEDNPELSNYNQKGIGGSANPFHTYIKNDVLYGSDGSKRFFEDDLLKQWVDAKGNTLTFSYENRRLSRIENSNGNFCGLHYNHGGNVSEIYAKDGRRISYDYDSQGDLVKVTLPNTAVISYDYDRAHRIIRETKPQGKVLENIYDDEGRVKEQRSPMGPQQEMVTTATFNYADGVTTVTDAGGGKTIYHIFQKQIYKVTDPLGYYTLQSWFIDEKSWFDPETEQIIEWNQKGGATRSLKSTTDKRGLTTTYLYDSQGNPEEIGLNGEDLTGSGETVIAKKLAYNDRNLCIEEVACGQKTMTTYDAIFPYLPKRIEKYSGNTLLSYVDLEYNSLGQIEKEDNSGAITLWKYDTRGFPQQKIQITGTDDPDVITTYAYNNQGQCIEVTSVDGTQKNSYDLMGNLEQSKTLSPSGTLISATYMGYDLNCAPIWKQTANSENIVYFDYHASGLLKAIRQSLAPSRSIAYTLYDYDPRGYLIEETDPRGYCTYRDYDALGKVKSETKEGHSTLFSYEPGGLVQTITSPSGAQTTRHYTTNGLLKAENYPDGTRHSIVYDFFGRPILETKNDIVWEIKYDDANRQVIRTHVKTKNTEISEFDVRGNLTRFTDAAGYTSEKTYDGLNRIKTETTPSGKQTVWSYQDNIVICTLPNGEKTTIHYEGGQVVKSEVTDPQGTLIASSSVHFDPENDREALVRGEETTITWRNTLDLPIKIKKGNITATHEYDACGNCIVSIDGDGRTTRQEFDELCRLIQKELPDKSVIKYDYDLDSNLIGYRLPNNTVWKASYDSMQRKCSEELQAGKGSSGHWDFTYENGYLKEATDPMRRTHTYLYDSYGRLWQDAVDGSRRIYTYDLRGFLVTAEQASNREHSLVERSYDSDGNLFLESVYLNSNLLQRTCQKWTPSSRSLQIGQHQRDFNYQNNRLVQVSTQNVALSYTYDLGGALKSKNNRLSSTTIDYNPSGLPKSVLTRLPDGSYQERLEWHPSGKLYTYTAPQQQQEFTYNARGYLNSTGAERFDFDFGSIGTGVRTAAPNWYVPQDGLDEFGKILTSIVDKTSSTTDYNLMGQVISNNRRQFEWDPWGRLLKAADSALTWEASYDALGRRLQTRYTQDGNSIFTMTSFYDPEEEFQEIGIQFGNNTFWKVYGPNSCEALTDETGASVVLMQNSLGQLAGIVSSEGTLPSEKFPSAYGPQLTTVPVPTDLISYAQSLSWQSKAQDPTGLIWMGERYYDPNGGRFLSPDPVSYPICLDLYTYANGDPINYIDPDGRFASQVYQTTKKTVISTFNGPTFQGSVQAFGGLTEAAAGGTMTLTGWAAPIGVPVMIHGLDHYFTGMNTAFTGRPKDTVTSQFLQMSGMSHQTAGMVDNGISIFGTMGGIAAIRATGQITRTNLAFKNTFTYEMEYAAKAGQNFKSFTKWNFRHNLSELTGISPGRGLQAHHIFPQGFEKDFMLRGINIHNPKYGTWWQTTNHQRNARQYNLEWKEYFRKHPEATETQILEKGKQLMINYGIEVHY